MRKANSLLVIGSVSTNREVDKLISRKLASHHWMVERSEDSHYYFDDEDEVEMFKHKIEQYANELYRQYRDEKSRKKNAWFEWLVVNHERLMKKYDGRWLVVKDFKVVKSYDDYVKAVRYGNLNLGHDNFIVQKCDKEMSQQSLYERNKPFSFCSF